MVGVGGSSPLGRTNKFKQKRRSLSGVFVFNALIIKYFYTISGFSSNSSHFLSLAPTFLFSNQKQLL